jgi:hypothetical protein
LADKHNWRSQELGYLLLILFGATERELISHLFILNLKKALFFIVDNNIGGCIGCFVLAFDVIQKLLNQVWISRLQQKIRNIQNWKCTIEVSTCKIAIFFICFHHLAQLDRNRFCMSNKKAFRQWIIPNFLIYRIRFSNILTEFLSIYKKFDWYFDFGWIFVILENSGKFWKKYSEIITNFFISLKFKKSFILILYIKFLRFYYYFYNSNHVVGSYQLLEFSTILFPFLKSWINQMRNSWRHL